MRENSDIEQNRKMNIWIVNHYAMPPSMGGLVRHYYFSKYLQTKGHQVRIITSGRIHNTTINMTDEGELYSVKEVDGVEYTFVKSSNYTGNGLDRIKNLIGFPFNVWKTMKSFYKKEKPDVIYTSSPDLFVAFFSEIYAKLKKIPIIVEIRDLWPESIVEYKGISKKNPIILILYQLEKWIYENANKLIFTMPGGKDYITDKKWDKKIELSKIVHINNGVDFLEYKKNISDYVIDDDDLNDKSKFKVIYVGSIRAANNIRNLVDVAIKLKEDNINNVCILIYGDGNERADLENECKKLQLDNIVFKGKVDKKYIPYILSKSNLNILNYKQASTWKYGGSQNKQFEYLASGRPICANVKMGYSIINEYKCGIEEDIDTVDRYVEIIKMYSNMSETEYKQQCENAVEAAKKYDYNILGMKIEKTLVDLVHGEVRK